MHCVVCECAHCFMFCHLSEVATMPPTLLLGFQYTTHAWSMASFSILCEIYGVFTNCKNTDRSVYLEAMQLIDQ